MKRWPAMVSCIAALLSHLGLSRAQSLNLDFQPINSPAGTAASSYGGPAPYPGTWNPIQAVPSVNLLSIAGATTSVALSTDANALMTFVTSNQAVAPDAALVNDAMRANTNAYTITLSGLANGTYSVVVVCVESINIFATRIEVFGALEAPRYCGGDWSGSFVPGSLSSGDTAGNYVAFTKSVVDGTVQVRLIVSGFTDQPTINALQLIKLEPFASSCFGDSGSLVCPCGNLGLAGRGCGNSANATGALLTASGTQAPDSLILQSAGLPTPSVGLLVQAQGLGTPTTFGDGASCLSGNLQRMYIQAATSGTLLLPPSGGPSISARSLALGDALIPGSTRHYQVIYRDSNAVFCPAPQGGNFNTTNALSIVW